MQEIVNILIAAVAHRIMQGRHTGRYLESKRVTMSGGDSPADPQPAVKETGHVICGAWT
jgi:hypothetical protein